MPNLNLVTKEQYVRERQFQAPLPGEIFTRKRKSLPFDRPPVAPDPSVALDILFKGLMKKQNARQVLGLMDAGVPVDTIAGTILTHSVGEGLTTPQGAILMTPSLLTMLVRMGQEANIEPKFSFDNAGDPITADELNIAQLKSDDSIKVGRMTKAVEQSSDLVELPKSEAGLLKKPEELA